MNMLPRHSRFACASVLSLLIVCSLPVAASAKAAQPLQSADTTASQQPAAVEPYESDRSVAYHMLATPAYVLHGATRPIGWTVKYLERNFPQLFRPEPQQRGVLPLIELGGPVGVAGGLALYDNKLFGTDQKARIEALYGARDFFEIEFRYERPRLFGPATRFFFETNYFSEPEDRFYFGGIGGDRTDDRALFSRRQIDVMTRVQYEPGSPFNGALDVLYEHVDASPKTGPEGGLLDGRPGLEPTDLLTPRVELAFDFTRGQQRAYAGTKVLLRLDYTHDLNGDHFRYGRYMAAVQQFVPVLVFPKTRRLALRGRLEQVEPLLGGESVPFFQLPRLGGQQTLRGFLSDRFRDTGSLLFSAEYRYPVWGRMDAVFFVDTGQVFGALDEVDARDFRTTFGGGFHLLSGSGLSARFEVARSVEGVEVILTVKPAFGRAPR